MTDRYHSLTVVLKEDMRADDAEEIIKAILCLRDVVSVTGAVTNIDSWMAEVRAKSELRMKLFEALK